MRKQFFLSLVTLLALSVPVSAHVNPNAAARPNTPTRSAQQRIDFRMACDNAVAQIDMDINNVRARLTTGGDVWWDGSDGRYVVPKTPPGVPEVSSIFAGAVWLGGRSPGGDLKTAAQQYGRGGGEFDYYPGPLTRAGTTGQDTCAAWDQFFVVSGESIREVRAAFQNLLPGETLSASDIPEDVLGWPGFGNEFFFDVHGFELPTERQGLAGYWDEDLDGIYDPTQGDYPIIEIRGCNETPQFPEEMTFWIYNDAGNLHRESNTVNQLNMEVQVQAFAYTTSDDINSMTFQRYKLINRATEDLLDTYFAMWVDPDLGCFTDDYVGCDTTRSLAYVYNEDELDGANGCTCTGGVNTYCDEIPILGVDYFRGPRAPIFDPVTGQQIGTEELGMSSFIYLNNCGVGDPPPATCDPNTSEEYYNYLQGRWLDGTPLYNTGNGYDQASPPAEVTRYAFSSAPNDPNGWSMVTADLPFGDRRTLQASGPFTLQPGAVNELIIGVVWVPDQTYPAPSIQRLQQADDLAQSLFDNCFDICDGPDAPDVDVLELDREIVLLLSNDQASNNFNEEYTEPGLGIPEFITVDGRQVRADSLYRFEGYRVFQFSGPDVSLAEIDDPERVREIAQFDLRNDVTRVFDWRPVTEDDNPLTTPFLAPSLRAVGSDNGIQHSLSIVEDAFASGGETRLVNHRRYYFTVVAYAYNNYKEYDPFDQDQPGQSQQYKASSRNIGDELTGNPYYQVIPRPILDVELMAEYGDETPITRISGQGNNGNFLDINDETREAIEAAFAAGEEFDGEITYQTGAGPIDVTIVNPLGIQNGEYEITFTDEDMSDDEVEDNSMWMLRCLDGCDAPTILSERPINEANEQIVPQFGFSVSIFNVEEPGTETVAGVIEGNGVIGGTITYDDPEQDPWLAFIPDNFILRTGLVALDNQLFDYVTTEEFDDNEELDPEQDFNNLFPGIYPYALMDGDPFPNGLPFLTPTWLGPTNPGENLSPLPLDQMPNVDIVMTSNKELWTRCPVIETSNYFYNGVVVNGDPIESSDRPIMFDTRNTPSVTREAGSDGLPAVDPNPGDGLETGMGWFPGYAVDVETGTRLQMFFGENSLYDGRELANGENAPAIGADMMFNPGEQLFLETGENLTLYNFMAGAQHFFYVAAQEYDEGVFLESRFETRTSLGRKRRGIESIAYAGFPLRIPGSNMLSYEEGLIPNDVTIKLRVNNEFGFAEGTDDSNGYPTYRFSIDEKAAGDLDDVGITRALDAINVVPNPYYGFSEYEDSQFENIVKITNLPAQATVTIYSLDGKFIRKYERDERETMLRGGNRAVGSRQISPALEWDLNNFRGIPVASGVYLIHVNAPGFGERTLKFFGVRRQFDPSGL